MCHADVTPIPFHWSRSRSPDQEPDDEVMVKLGKGDENNNKNENATGDDDGLLEITPMLTIPHTCRDFDAIRD